MRVLACSSLFPKSQPNGWPTEVVSKYLLSFFSNFFLDTGRHRGNEQDQQTSTVAFDRGTERECGKVTPHPSVTAAYIFLPFLQKKFIIIMIVTVT